MSPPPDDPTAPTPSRVELTDSRGMVRAVVGQLHADDGAGGEGYGVSLRDANGSERAVLSVDTYGPRLVLTQNGNVAVHVGVDDALVPGDHRGASVVVADADGTPLLRLWVDEATATLRVTGGGGDGGG